MHSTAGGTGDADGFEELAFCAFCASPIPASGVPCCADYAATVEQPPELATPEPERIPARELVPVPAAPIHVARSEPPSRDRYLTVAHLLLGLLAVCVSVLAVMLWKQAQFAAERERELAETRRLSEEMIAVMKEARHEAAMRGVTPQKPETTATGVETAPAIVQPPVAPESSSTVASADVFANSVAAALPAVPLVDPKRPMMLRPASEAPAAAIAATSAEAPPSADPPAAVGTTAATAPTDPAPNPLAERVVAPKPAEPVRAAVKEKLEPRRPSPAAEARETTADRELASLGPAKPPTKREPTAAEAAALFRELEPLPPALWNKRLPPRAVVGPWAKLERGMSREHVRRILGAPRATDHLKTAEFWFYAETTMFGRGWVAFSKGTVLEWSTPEARSDR